MDISGERTRIRGAEREILSKVNSRLDRDTKYVDVLNILIQEYFGSSGARDAIVYNLTPRTKRLRLVIAIIDGEPVADPFDVANLGGDLPPRALSLPKWRDFRWRGQLLPQLLGGHDHSISKGLDRWHRRRQHTLCIWSLLITGTRPIGLLGVAMCQRPGQQGLAKVSQRLSQQVALAMQMEAVSEAEKRFAAKIAVDDERLRIAAELHDILAYSLTAVLMQLEAAKELLPTKPGITLDCLDRASSVAKEALRQSRQAVMKLQATHVKPLITSLEALVAGCDNGAKPTCSFLMTGLPYLLPPESERHLLRISQEAIGNARRYANASTIQVSLAFLPVSVTLVIEDDGTGFVFSEAEGMGFGLSSMSKRAERIGASINIRTGLGLGTTVSVRLDNPQSPASDEKLSRK